VTTRTTTARETVMAISSNRCSAYAGVRVNNWCSETETCRYSNCGVVYFKTNS